MKLVAFRNFLMIVGLALLVLVIGSSEARAQGRNRRASNWDKKCAKFVNCHDASEGRLDGRGPSRQTDDDSWNWRRHRRDSDDDNNWRRRRRDGDGDRDRDWGRDRDRDRDRDWSRDRDRDRDRDRNERRRDRRTTDDRNETRSRRSR
jgi:hypothetical protein